MLPGNMAGKKILVVEDEQALREMYETKLKIAGFEVETAEDGEEAIKKIKNNTPDLTLLDIMLPKKNGFDVLEEVRKEKDLASLPIIMLTNLSQESDIKLAVSLGARDYIIKSNIMLNDLVNKVKSHLALA